MASIYYLIQPPHQAGHCIYNLVTSKEFRCTHQAVKLVLVMDMVLKHVAQLVKCDDIKELQFTDKNGHVLHPTDWLTGVDYEDFDDETEYHQNENTKEQGENEG